jgi:hypothetical protein
MLPVSVTAVGPNTFCTETTDYLCGAVGPEGCSFEPFLAGPPELTPTPKPSKPDAAAGASVAKASDDMDDGGHGKRNIVAASIGIPIVIIALIAVVSYYIVLPWMRGATRSDPGRSSRQQVQA